MKRVYLGALAGSSLLLLAACATTPPGPMIPVMPGPHKSPAAFNADQIACEQYAADVVQGHVQAENSQQVTNGVVGGAVGAGLGAAVAHNAGKGALVGGALGALIGSTAGAGYGQAGVQQHYDMAYASCMTSRGNEIPGAPPHRPRWYYKRGLPPGYAAPPPPADDRGPPPDDRGPPPDDQGPPPSDH